MEQARTGGNPDAAFVDALGDSHPLDRCSGQLRLRSGAAARGVVKAIKYCAVGLGFLALAAGALMWRLSAGPISIDQLTPRMAEELRSRFGPGYNFALGSASLEHGAHGPSLFVQGFSVSNSEGRSIIAAPRAELSVAALPLLSGSLRPTRLDLYDVDMRLTLLADGGLALSAGEEPLVLRAPPNHDAATATQPEAAASTHFQALAAALHRLVDFATEPGSSIGSLERMGVVRGKLAFEQAENGQVTVFEGLNLDFVKHDGEARFTISGQGPRGRWNFVARAMAKNGGARGLDIDITDFSRDEIALLAGLRGDEALFDNPLSASLKFSLSPDGQIASASGGFAVGAGALKAGPDNKEFLFIDEVTGRLRWNSAQRRVDFNELNFASGETRLNLSGFLTPPSLVEAPWLFAIEEGSSGFVGGEKAGESGIVIDRLRLSAGIFPDASRLVVEHFEAAGPQVNISLNAEAVGQATRRRLKIGGNVGKMPTAAILRLWPKFMAPSIRDYLVDHARGGFLEKAALQFDFDEDAIANLANPKPHPDDSIHVDYAVSGVSLSFLPGVPALGAVDGTGKLTGRTASFNASRGVVDVGGGKKLALSEALFYVQDTSRKPAPATLTARVTAPLEAIGDFLSRDGMKPFGGMHIDTAAMKGQFDGKLTIDMKLAKVTRASDTSVKVAAAVNGFSIEKLIGKEKFDNGVLNLTVDSQGLKASGQGRLFGGPATLEIKKPQAGAADAIVQFAIDDAARARMGFGAGVGISGPIGVKLAAPFGKEDASANVELDFSRASIDAPIPGLGKAAGKPAKATFVLDPSEGSNSVTQLVYDAPGGPSARGALEFDQNGAFRSAQLSSLRLSPGDDMKVNADLTKEGLKLVVRGAAVDTRPFLRGLMGGESNATGKDAAASKDIDIDLKTALATGYNRQTLSGVELRLTRKAGAIRSFQLQASSGKAAISGGMSRGREGGAINLSVADGGAFMAFLDLYKRMEGGKMLLNARLTDGGLDGSIHITDFVLRNEPALRRLVTEGAPTRDGLAGQQRIETSAAAFTRLSASFTRGGGRFAVRDGVLVGQQIGLKLDGTLDTARDQVNMTGVFVPAYGLNNLFSQVPLVGSILGGDRHEGLFAVNFRITGPAAAPVLTINPLSAIAPGFLRKVFGVIDGTGTPSRAPVEAQPESLSRDMPLSIGPARN